MIGDIVRIAKYDLPFRKGYKPNFTQEAFYIVAMSSRELLTFTIKDEQVEIICGKLYQNELIKVIQRWIRLKYSWFLMHMHSFFRTKH